MKRARRVVSVLLTEARGRWQSGPEAHGLVEFKCEPGQWCLHLEREPRWKRPLSDLVRTPQMSLLLGVLHLTGCVRGAPLLFSLVDLVA